MLVHICFMIEELDQGKVEAGRPGESRRVPWRLVATMFSRDWQRSHWHPKYRTRQKRPSPWWFPASCWWCQLAKAFSLSSLNEGVEPSRPWTLLYMIRISYDQLLTVAYVRLRILKNHYGKTKWMTLRGGVVGASFCPFLVWFDLQYEEISSENEEPGRPQSWSRVADRI